MGFPKFIDVDHVRNTVCDHHRGVGRRLRQANLPSQVLPDPLALRPSVRHAGVLVNVSVRPAVDESALVPSKGVQRRATRSRRREGQC